MTSSSTRRALVLVPLALILAATLRLRADSVPTRRFDLFASPDSVVAVARAATRALTDTAAARRAGFVPLGREGMRDLSPLQGQHWVHRQRMRANTVALPAPPVLMYSPVAGSMRLVGVAYAQRIDASAKLPATLGGVPAEWHAHVPCLGGTVELSLPPSAAACRAQGGQPAPRRIAMVHLWLDLPSPDGPFAHGNPALPFLAAGVPLPAFDAGDAAARAALGETVLALGDAHDMQLPLARWVLRDAAPADRRKLDAERQALQRAAAAFAASAQHDGAPSTEDLHAAWRLTRAAYLNAASPARAALLAAQLNAISAGAHSGGHGAAHDDAHGASHDHHHPAGHQGKSPRTRG